MYAREQMESSTDQPYLSVVTVARNDDHGGDPLYRMQLFVDALLEQCDRHEVPAELILVEWNPPADRPGLAEAIRWPPTSGWCDVRIVQVPYELHSRLEHSDRLPLFQMIGKNVGIRRARGQFVLATNIDLIFSDDLMELVASRKLEPDEVYRVDRYDVPARIDPTWPLSERLRYCEANVLRVNRREGTYDLRTGEFFQIYDRIPLLGRIPFVPSLVTVRYRMFRYVLWRIYAASYWFFAGLWPPRAVPGRMKKRLVTLAALAVDAAPLPSLSDEARTTRRYRRVLSGLVPVARGAWRGFREKLGRFRWEWAREVARIRLHSNASGDFTLMAKEAWARAGGYAELQMYSMHVDGLVLYQAHYSGTRETFLPHKIFHVEHGGGFKPESDDLEQTLVRKAIPQITNEQLLDYIHQMYVTKQPFPFNRPDWGFAEEQLPERRLDLAPQQRVVVGSS